VAHSRRVSLRRFSLCLLLAPLGCASSPYPSVDEPMPPPEPAALPPSSASSASGVPGKPIAAGTLERGDVERVVDAGLGSFLSHVAIEPSLSAGKFQGWSIVELVPAEAWRDIDLRPGDVVTRVNGMAIEREVQAFDAFQAVRHAPSLEISYLRQRQPRTLRFTIVGAPSPSLPKAAPAANPG
jgi:S1-C subfamily serine protease